VPGVTSASGSADVSSAFMAPRQYLVRTIAVLLLTLLAATACASQTGVEPMSDIERAVQGSPLAPAEARATALAKTSAKRAVVDSVPLDDKAGQPDLVILLDDRTDKDEEDDGPPTRGGRQVATDIDPDIADSDGTDSTDPDSSDPDPDSTDPDADTTDPGTDSTDPDVDSTEEVVQQPQPDPVLTDDAIDLSETTDEVACELTTLEPWDGLDTIVAHPAVDGVLVSPCLGSTDQRLLYAWRVVATITPPEYLDNIGLFSGFNSNEDTGQTTLAFAIPPVTEDGAFQISVNLDYFENNRNGLFLTMAHEVAHIITVDPSQLQDDAEDEDEDEDPVLRQLDYDLGCRTYADRHGCYMDDALMYDWITTFWGNGLLAQVQTVDHGDHHHAGGPPVDRATGEDRCARYAGFLGPYAANHPEEDFAETFSAFVFDVPVEAPELQAKLDWFAEQPRLAEFRERVEEAGFPTIGNSFASCG